MSLHHVLGILESDENRLWTVLDRAVALAEAEGADLTLAKTSDTGRITRCLEPLVRLSIMSRARPETQAGEADRLARAAEFVPGSLSIKTLILGPEPRSELSELICGGTYDVVVATVALLGRHRWLIREMRRHGVCALAVPIGPVAPPTAGCQWTTARSAGPAARLPR